MPLQSDLMAAVLRVLRPGGRFILVNPFGDVDAEWVRLLENAGYVRILVEAAVDEQGVLIRGERVHETADTLARVQGVAGRDADLLDLETYRGRYVHLLVRQTPNKPVWRLGPDDVLTWEAAAIREGGDLILLGFSSLPKAVGLMQPAVLEGLVHGVNKVGKFTKDVARTWPHAVLMNPTLERIQGADVQFLAVDPQSAEAPDE
jgi:SAM-dependent methyltransferase